MKVIATQEGVLLKPTDTEKHVLVQYAQKTDYTARQILEVMAQIHGSNWEEDVKSAIEALDEEALDKEAENV